jgi:Uma2 family endonuclease
MSIVLPDAPPTEWTIAHVHTRLPGENNTAAEMDRKLHEYFAAGVRLVWHIDPTTRTANAYTALDQWTEVGTSDSLLGGEVLPGFKLPLEQLFDWVKTPGEE